MDLTASRQALTTTTALKSSSVTVTNLEETISITADTDDNMLPINNAHQVLSKGDTSLRIQHINGQIPADIYCCMASQMGNSTFTNVDLSDTNRPLVIDPTVSHDTLIDLIDCATFDGKMVTDKISFMGHYIAINSL
jgi:hypothetical protein